MIALLQKLLKFVFGYSKLLKDFMEQPASDIAISMHGNGCCSAVRMLPSGVAAFLPSYLEAQLSGNLLQVSSSGRHKRPFHQYPLEAFAHLLRALLLSYRRH